MIIKIYLDVIIITTFLIIYVINCIAIRILKAKTNRLIVLISSILVSFVTSCTYVFFQEYLYVAASILIILNSLAIFQYKNILSFCKQIFICMLSTMLVEMTLYTLINITKNYTIVVLIVSFIRSEEHV